LGKDDCEPEKMVELSVEKKEKNNNTKVLNNIEDYKDLPIPLCTFQITNNNFILSITCPETFSKSKKNEIFLDLYFFRPPAIERANKKNNNITVIIDEDKEKNRKFIREYNGGLCNIHNNFDSFCTTDMNTTTDLEGNLLSYNEFAVTNITRDENNYYIRKKLTNLKDETDKTDNLDVIKYKESFEKLLYNLDPYMKEDIKFTTENFIELYNIWKLNDFPVPGFPTIINGTLFIIQVKHVKRFSLNDLFNAIPLPFSIVISFVILFISFSGIFKKLLFGYK
jgi:hypothetical protein